MNIKMIANLIGRILCLEAAFLLSAALVSLYYGEPGALRAIGVSAFITAGTGALLMLPHPKKNSFYAREGFISVALSWIVISLFGALPFYISGEIPLFIDCVFETISGFTTTGASILPNVEILSKGLLYWRSFTHWIGGMGVLVFMLAIDPMSRGSGRSVYLLRAESPGPEVEKLVPKMHQSAMILYGIYIGMTILEALLLLAGGMPLFDTVTTAFGTAGTGGFGVRADSMASYSPYLQTIVTIFMGLFGVNFSIYYLLLNGRISQALRNNEARLYFGILITSSVLIALNTRPLYGSALEALHHSAFQVSSIMTTTGYATVDFNLWPEFSKCVLLLLMLVGACGGSTGGGAKVSRVLLLFRMMRCEFKRMSSPRSVNVVRMDGKPVTDATLRGIVQFLTAYISVAGVSFLLVSLDNFGMETTLSAVLACLNNIGPGLGLVGPMGNYDGFSAGTKMVLCMDMLLGRLEVLPLLMLFMPGVWRRAQ